MAEPENEVLFEQFVTYLNRLEAGARNAFRHVCGAAVQSQSTTLTKRADLLKLWERIQKNPVLRSQWRQRLSENGYDKVKQEIRDELQRIPASLFADFNALKISERDAA